MTLLTFRMKQGVSKDNAIATIEKVYIEYNGHSVRARRLTVSSIIPIKIDKAWENLQTPKLLQFVAKGMITFKSINEEGFPHKWEKGKTYGVKMRIFGIIPFGGTHFINIAEINSSNYRISTKEWDSSAKVWNHNVQMKTIGNDSIQYVDSIEIYGGFMTGFITAFAKYFYKHRQKRWQIVANESLEFGK